MDFGAIVLICTVAGAFIGGVAGAAIWFMKANKVRKHYNVGKGMSYEQITAALGEPKLKKQKGTKLICQWYVNPDGKYYNVSAVFIDNKVKNIG